MQKFGEWAGPVGDDSARIPTPRGIAHERIFGKQESRTRPVRDVGLDRRRCPKAGSPECVPRNITPSFATHGLRCLPRRFRSSPLQHVAVLGLAIPLASGPNLRGMACHRVKPAVDDGELKLPCLGTVVGSSGHLSTLKLSELICSWFAYPELNASFELKYGSLAIPAIGGILRVEIGHDVDDPAAARPSAIPPEAAGFSIERPISDCGWVAAVNGWDRRENVPALGNAVLARREIQQAQTELSQWLFGTSGFWRSALRADLMSGMSNAEADESNHQHHDHQIDQSGCHRATGWSRSTRCAYPPGSAPRRGSSFASKIGIKRYRRSGRGEEWNQR